VEEGAWQGLVDRLVAGVRAGRLAEALVAAVAECGDLLERHGVAIEPDDTDELANEPRVRDR
jgi:putative membrane protein